MTRAGPLSGMMNKKLKMSKTYLVSCRGASCRDRLVSCRGVSFGSKSQGRDKGGKQYNIIIIGRLRRRTEVDRQIVKTHYIPILPSRKCNGVLLLWPLIKLIIGMLEEINVRILTWAFWACWRSVMTPGTSSGACLACQEVGGTRAPTAARLVSYPPPDSPTVLAFLRVSIVIPF